MRVVERVQAPPLTRDIRSLVIPTSLKATSATSLEVRAWLGLNASHIHVALVAGKGKGGKGRGAAGFRRDQGGRNFSSGGGSGNGGNWSGGGGRERFNKAQ